MAVKKHLCTINVTKVTGLTTPVDPSDAANKEYVDNALNTSTPQLSFWLADESQVCIDLDQNKLPFWLADETYSPIDLGCP